jgi:hypothetical protein
MHPLRAILDDVAKQYALDVKVRRREKFLHVRVLGEDRVAVARRHMCFDRSG